MDAEVGVKRRLSAMMALVWSVQGAFWPLLSIHLVDLKVTERSRGWIFATMAMASFAMPLGAGQLVDRIMPTQRFLSISFGLGTFLLALMAWGVSSHSGWLFVLFLSYWLLMAPSYSLSGAMAFRNLAHPGRDFGKVRLWGTVGWMAVGWIVSGLMAWSGHRIGQGTSEAFWVAAALSAATALYCRTLPNTPPMPGVRRTSSFRDAAELLQAPGMRVYLILTFGVSLTTPFVYQVMPNYFRSIGMDRAWVSTAMSLGQWPEVVMLVGLPWLIRWTGYRFTLGLGIAAYALRYASLAFDPPLWFAIAGIPLHGIGVACFSIGGQMYVDSKAPSDRRASAQSINTMLSGGLGSLLGSLLAGEALRLFAGRMNLVFIVPFAINFGLIFLLVRKFRPDLRIKKILEQSSTSLFNNGRTGRSTVSNSTES